MSDHFIFQANISQKEPLSSEGKLRIQGRHIVVEGQIPSEIGIFVILEYETVEIAVGEQSELGIYPETLIREIIAEFQCEAVTVVAEDSGAEFAVYVPVPRVSERLGQAYHSRMDSILQISVSVIEERELDLVSELHSRPKRHLHRRTDLPQGLIYLIDDEVHY